MSSPRKHPSRYPTRLTDLLLGPTITLYFPTHQAAINFRYQLYAFRESLRKHPGYNISLLGVANTTSFFVLKRQLCIIKPKVTQP